MNITVNIIEKALIEWDPIGLFPFAPKDEYRDESVSVYKVIGQSSDAVKVAYAVHSVFLNSFGKNTFPLSIDECMGVAESIVKNATYHP
jgi:hypothetical protein